MFNLEDLLGSALNGMRYGVAVSGAQHQSSQDQHIESALEHLGLKRGFAAWHDFGLFH